VSSKIIYKSSENTYWKCVRRAISNSRSATCLIPNYPTS